MPKSGSDIQLPGQRDLVVPADLPETTFLLSGVTVEGANSVDVGELEALYSGKIGTEINLATFYGIANDITALYRNRGYILSQAVIPEQEISGDAPVVIRVIEGFVSDVAYTDNTLSQGRKDRLRRYSDKIISSRPLTADVLERYLLLLNDLPGYAVVATLSPSREPNAATMTLVVQRDKQKYNARIENRGNDFIGPFRLRGTAEFNDLSEAMNSLGLTLISTLNSELAYALVQQRIPVGSEGLEFQQSIGVQSSQPGGALEELEIDSSLTRIDLSASYPLVRSRRENLSISGTLSFLDSESTQLEGVAGAESLKTEDAVRSIRIGFGYDKLDTYRGLNIVAGELSHGLDVLDAEVNTRVGASVEYDKATLFLGRLQSLVPRVSLFAGLVTQYSDDVLPSSEQFGVGGKEFGSAFDASEIVGDSGYAGRLELRYTAPPPGNLLKGLVTYTFVDGGEVTRNEPTEDQEETESLSSSGLGIRFDFANSWGGSLEYAVPLSNEVASEGNDDGRLFLVLESTF